MNRKTDNNNQNHHRSDRMTLLGDSWYFNTREGRLVGPYMSKEEALDDLARYISQAEAGTLNTEDYASISNSEAGTA